MEMLEAVIQVGRKGTTPVTGFKPNCVSYCLSVLPGSTDTSAFLDMKCPSHRILASIAFTAKHLANFSWKKQYLIV